MLTDGCRAQHSANSGRSLPACFSHVPRDHSWVGRAERSPRKSAYCVPGTVPRVLCALRHLILPTTQDTHNPILQRGQPRSRVVKSLAQGHTTRKWLPSHSSVSPRHNAGTSGQPTDPPLKEHAAFPTVPGSHGPANKPGKAAFSVTPDFPCHALQVTRLLPRGILTKPYGDLGHYDDLHETKETIEAREAKTRPKTDTQGSGRAYQALPIGPPAPPRAGTKTT